MFISRGEYLGMWKNPHPKPEGKAELLSLTCSQGGTACSAKAAPWWEMLLCEDRWRTCCLVPSIFCAPCVSARILKRFLLSKRLFVWVWPLGTCDTCLKLLTRCPAKINCLADADHYLKVKTSINITSLIVLVTDSADCFMLQLNSLDIAFLYICSQPWRDHLTSRAGAGSLQTREIPPPWPRQVFSCSSPLRFAASQVSSSQGAAGASCLSPGCL